ncbi:MAG: hypothetical protein ACXAC7_21070 [Candidatus Hodarchaeales archaeon]|jgi:hypothetical protein
MKKFIKLIGFCLISTFLLVNSLGAGAQTTMKDLLGVDFEEDFAIEIDFNGNYQTEMYEVEVINDLNNPNNPALSTNDSYSANDQHFFMSHFNTSGISTSYIAVEKLEADLVINPPIGDPIILGHVNGSVPFQTLLQYFQYEGDDVFVANTFRGYVAYTTSPEDDTIDPSDDIYVGYTLVEKHLLDKLNDYLTTHQFPKIPEYNYEPIYDPANKKFGMKYTNFFIVWQDTEADSPASLNLIKQYLDGFDGVATGENLIAASLFESLTFTYQIIEREVNSTHTIIDIVTEYDIGPMEWLITQDQESMHNLIIQYVPGIDESNTFHEPAFEISFDTGYAANTWTVTVPELTFYTGEAVSSRINAAAIEFLGPTSVAGPPGLGISVVTSSNVIRIGETLERFPNYDVQTLGVVIPFGEFFETSYVGKETYNRTLYDGTEETGLPIYISTRSIMEVDQLVQNVNLIDGYFTMQSTMTEGYTRFVAKELTGAQSTPTLSELNMEVSDSYVTFVQMPYWNGLKVVQDPIYSAVAKRMAILTPATVTETITKTIPETVTIIDPITITEPKTITETTANVALTAVFIAIFSIVIYRKNKRIK